MTVCPLLPFAFVSASLQQQQQQSPLMPLVVVKEEVVVFVLPVEGARAPLEETVVALVLSALEVNDHWW